MISEFGSILKDWRKVRRFSQLDLSLEAEMSTRHLSFLESGRANPSREMVMRLSDALQLPRPATNQ
ncbi:MAG: helix-turn-helix transcriptional regulator, partial [Marinomonas sp.]